MDQRKQRKQRSQRRSQGVLGAGIRFGRVFGVDLTVDWSLLIIFALIALDLGFGVFPAWHPDWGAGLIWVVALSAAVLFFVSILLHELSHAVVANANGIPVRRITLFVFGGMAHMEKEPPSARSEFVMAIVGPLTSIAIGVVAVLVATAISKESFAESAGSPFTVLRRVGPVATLLLWLGPINVLLGLFNLVPGFPLDGGRVLRAILWGSTGDLRKATRWASNVGRGFAWLLIGVGVFMLFGGYFPVIGGGLIQGFWLVLIGWFLNYAARASYQQLVVAQALGDVSVAEIMRRRTETVEEGASVDALVHEHIMRSDQHAFPVMRQGALIGLVSLTDVRRVSRADWERVTVAEIMTPVADLVTLRPDDPAKEALDRIAQSRVNQIPVMDDGHLEGVVQRDDLVKWLSLRSEEDVAARH